MQSSEPATAPIAKRIRERCAEMSMSLDEAGRRMGWSRGVFAATLRKLEAGEGDCTRDTYEKIAKVIDRPVWWILSGESGRRPAGFRLSDNPSWPAESAEASKRYKLSPEALLIVGQVRTPVPVRRLHAGLILMLADAM